MNKPRQGRKLLVSYALGVSEMGAYMAVEMQLSGITQPKECF